MHVIFTYLLVRLLKLYVKIICFKNKYQFNKLNLKKNVFIEFTSIGNGDIYYDFKCFTWFKYNLNHAYIIS
jgi:hypothetical protein